MLPRTSKNGVCSVPVHGKIFDSVSAGVRRVEFGGDAYEDAAPRHAAFSPPSTQTSKAVTKADIVDRIAAGTGLTKIETEAVVNGFISTVIQALKEGETIEIRGFGSFRVQYRAARVARNPRTNEEVEVGPRYVPTLRVSKELREAVDASVKERRARGLVR